MKVRSSFVANSSSSSFIVFAAMADKDITEVLNHTTNNLNNHISLINRAKHVISGGATIDRHIVPNEDYNLSRGIKESSFTLYDKIDEVIALTKRIIKVDNDEELLNEITKTYKNHYEQVEKYNQEERRPYKEEGEEDQYDDEITDDDEISESHIKYTYDSLITMMNEQSYQYPIYLDVHSYEEPEGYGTLWGPDDQSSYDIIAAYCTKKKIPVVDKCVSMFN